MNKDTAHSQTDIYVSPSGALHNLEHIDPLANVISDHKSSSLSLKDKVIKPRVITQTIYETISEELKRNNPNEKIIWIGRSSQLINTGIFVICFLFCWLIFPLLIAYLVYLHTKHTIFVLTQERLRVYSGVFSKRVEDLELYRVKHAAYLQPFFLGLFHLANIELDTSDISWGNNVIPGVENGMVLRENLRRWVELARTRKGVSEVDFYDRGHLPMK